MHLRKRTNEKELERRKEQEQFTPAFVERQEFRFVTPAHQTIRTIEVTPTLISKQEHTPIKWLIGVIACWLICCGIGITGFGIYIIADNAAREGTLAIGRDVGIELFLLVLLAVVSIFFALKEIGYAIAALATWLVLTCYVAMLNMQFASNNHTEAMRAQERQILAELEKGTELVTLRQTKDSKDHDKQLAEANRSKECADKPGARSGSGNGPECQKRTSEYNAALEAFDIASKAYMAAYKTAERQAKKDASPEKAAMANSVAILSFGCLNPSEDQIEALYLIFKMLLPMTGELAVMFGIRLLLKIG